MTALWAELRHHLSVAEFKKGLGIKVAYVMLHQADIILTSFAVSAGFRELNPVIRGALDAPVQLLAFKLVIPLVIAWLVPARLLLPALLLLLVVIGLNLRELSLWL